MTIETGTTTESRILIGLTVACVSFFSGLFVEKNEGWELGRGGKSEGKSKEVFSFGSRIVDSESFWERSETNDGAAGLCELWAET